MITPKPQCGVRNVECGIARLLPRRSILAKAGCVLVCLSTLNSQLSTAQAQSFTRTPAYRAAAAPRSSQNTVAVDWVETFQGGTNGNTLVSTQSFSTNISLWSGLGAGTWYASTNSIVSPIDGVIKRFAFDNTSVPPSPYTTWNQGGTLVGGSAVPFCLRYDANTNTTTYGGVSNSVIQWKPTSATITNLLMTVDFMTRIDGSSGGSGNYDFFIISRSTGASLNLKQGTAGGNTNEYVQLETATTGGAIPIDTNHWYRAALLVNSGGAALRMYDLQNSYALLTCDRGGSDSTNTLTANPITYIAFGQLGHASVAAPQAKSYYWMANMTLATNIASAWPPVYAKQWEPGFQQYVRAWTPVDSHSWTLPDPISALVMAAAHQPCRPKLQSEGGSTPN